MTLTDLTQAEKLALVGLARLMVRLDHELTDEETSALATLIDAFGTEPFWQLIRETDKMQNDDIKRAATEVVREDARALLYGTLYTIATASSIDRNETALLDWLEATWDLEIEDVPDGSTTE